MGIVSVNELYNIEAEVGFDTQRGWMRNYRRRFQVITNDNTIGAIGVAAAVPVAVGNTYSYPVSAPTETDKYAFVQRIVARCTQVDGLQWEVDVEYGPYDPTIRPESPLDQPPEVSWDANQFTRPAVVEADQGDGSTPQAIANTAGVPFDPAPQVDDSRPVLQVVRNEQTYDVGLATSYRDCVNDQPFLGWDPGTVKIHSISGRRAWHPICGYYWSVSYTLEFNELGWTSKPLDAGLTERRADGMLYAITDPNGVPVSSPVPLSGDGLANDIGVDDVYLEFHIYKQVDFGALDFDHIGPIVQGGGG